MGFNMEGLLRVLIGLHLIIGLSVFVDPLRLATCPGSIETSGPASTDGTGVTITVIGVRTLSHPPLV